MKRFKKILAVVDGSERDNVVMQRAGQLAQENKAALTLIQPIEVEVPIDEVYFATTLVRPDFAQESSKHVESHLGSQASSLSGEYNIAVDFAVPVGTGFVEVLRKVHEDHHDLVVISAEDEGSLVHRLLGSMCRRLVRKCPVPVWGIRPEHKQSYSRILAAVAIPDKSIASLNDEIMTLATSLAEIEASDLHVVHVWRPERTPFGENDSDYAHQIEEWVTTTERAHRRWFDEFMRTHQSNAMEINQHFIEGEPSVSIPHLAEKIEADLMVMGTRARGGLSGVLIGNTAETVLKNADRSLLVVKPSNFSCPIDFDES